MNTNLKKIDLPFTAFDAPEKKVQDADQMWFWFLTCRKKDVLSAASVSRMRIGISVAHNPYPCEAIDVETLVTRLYLSGKLSPKQLEVMKEFGDLRRAPRQHDWAENAKAALWCDAMRTIAHAAKIKEWLEN